MKGSLRRRLMTAFVGLVAGVLVIAGAGSIILTHNAARQQAKQQLVTEAQSLGTGASNTQRLAALRTVRRVLRLADARFVRVSAGGVVTSPLPPGLTSEDLDPQALLSGETVSGRDGNLVFAAAPVTLTVRERAQLRLGGQIAIVLTREVGDLGPSWGYFLISGGVALLIAALVAWQLSRRIARPLAEAVEATARIAAGDLDSHVPVRAHDYAESMSLGRSINEMAQTLKEGRSRERHLLLSVSHELRTPLTSIRGFAEAITDGAVDDTAAAAEVIIAESRRLERLVGDLLDLTKLESGQMSITARPSDVAEVVRTTAEGFRPQAERNGVHLAVEVPAEDMSPMLVDPDRLAQIVANLLENALTFARSRVNVALHLGHHDLPAVQVITVEDDGPGIAPADLARVFERFYQADSVRTGDSGPGSGWPSSTSSRRPWVPPCSVESPIFPTGGSRFTVTLGMLEPARH